MRIIAQDGRELEFVYEQGKKNTTLLFVHGMGSCIESGKYLRSMCKKQRFGYAAFDLRSHGLSSGERGYVKRFTEFTLDLEVALSQLSTDVVIVGTSMGGLIAMMLFGQKKFSKVKGCVLVTPPTRLCLPTPKWHIWLGKILLYVPFLDHVHFPLGIHAETATHDAQERRWLNSDPLLIRFITPPLYFGLLERMEWLRTAEHKGDIPLLVLTSGRDHTIDYSSQQEFIARLKISRKVEHKHYEDQFHSLLIETKREKVIKDIFDWVKKL